MSRTCQVDGWAASMPCPSTANVDLSVTIAVICYNSAAYIERCLRTIRAAIGTDVPVLVIDNASSDATVEFARQADPQSRIIALTQNIGHSAACNLALQLADTTWVLLQDHDTFVPQGWLAPLLRAAEQSWPDTAMVSARAIFADGERLHHDGGFIHFVGHMTLSHGFAPVADHPARTGEVWEVGAQAATSLLVHRARALSVGAFDARFFIYLNDWELALRMRMRGWRCYVAPDSVVYHLQGNRETSWRGQGSYPARRAFLIYRNRWMTIAKNYSWRTLITCAPAILLYDLLLLAAAARNGWLGVYVQALRDVIEHWDALMIQRVHIQRTRTCSDAELLSARSFSFVPGLIRGPVRLAQVGLEGFFALYWRLVSPARSLTGRFGRARRSQKSQRNHHD
jgi:GT2 family glycosyltransferase